MNTSGQEKASDMPQCLVVMYHYVIDKEHQFPGLKGISFDEFKTQVESMRNRFVFIPLRQYGEYCRGRGDIPPNACVLTFDDGFKEHARVVGPYLSAQKIPASFFIITRTLENREVLPIHRVHLLMAMLGEEKFFSEMGRSL